MIDELIYILNAVEDISKLFCASGISTVIPNSVSLHKLISQHSLKAKNDDVDNVRTRLAESISKRFLPKLEQK